MTHADGNYPQGGGIDEWPDTDDADWQTVLKVMRECALAWEPSARLLGNVRARDITRAIDAALASGKANTTCPECSGSTYCGSCWRCAGTGTVLTSDLLQNDLAELCRLAGLPDGARPATPHAVFQECLAAIRQRERSLRDTLKLALDNLQGIYDGDDLASPVIIEIGRKLETTNAR